MSTPSWIADFEMLKRLLPPPEGVPASENDWAKISADVGYAFPDDYRMICDVYGAGSINDCFWIYHPAVGLPENTLRNVVDAMRDVLQQRLEHRKFPEFELPSADRLLPCAGTDSRAIIAWKMEGSPGRWPLVVFDNKGEFFQPASKSLVAFLVALLTNQSDLVDRVIPRSWFESPQYGKATPRLGYEKIDAPRPIPPVSATPSQSSAEPPEIEEPVNPLVKRHAIPYPHEFPWCAAFGPYPLMAAGGYGGGDLCIYDLARGTVIPSESTDAYVGVVYDVQWIMKTGTILTIGAKEREVSAPVAVVWWDAATLRPQKHLDDPLKCRDAALSPCGRYAALPGNDRVRFLHLDDGTHRDYTVKAERCRFSSDGNLVAIYIESEAVIYVEGNTAHRCEIRIVDVASQTVIQRLGTGTFVRSMLFTRDGTMFIVGELGGQITAWSTETWTERYQLLAPDDADRIAYADRRKVLTVYSYYETNCSLFAIETGEKVAEFRSPDRPHVFEIDPREEFLACDSCGDVEVWEMPPLDT